MSDSVKFYKGNDGTEFEQRKLVLGQIKRLVSHFPEVFEAAASGMNALAMIPLILDKAIVFCAIVLIPKGAARPPSNDADFTAHLTNIEETVDSETAMEIIDDFFAVTPISSLIQRAREIGARRAKEFPVLASLIGSSANSRTETPQSTTESSGDATGNAPEST